MNISDIEGTKARVRHPVRKNPEAVKKIFNPLDYTDVTHVDFKSKRTVNPLMPTYLVRDDNGKVETIGEVLGNKPQALPPARKDENYLKTSLKTEDIHMCSIGTKKLGNFHTRQRREFKQTNITSDIFGSNSGSLKKAPITNRMTHPLNPEYKWS